MTRKTLRPTAATRAAGSPPRHAAGRWLYLTLAVQTTALAIALGRQAFLHHRLGWTTRHDALTGLANRALLAERLTRRLTRALGGGDTVPGALLLLDLDDFKDVNDTLGPAVGDELLVAVATRLRVAAGPADTVARAGGDEFGIFLEGTRAALLHEAGERLLARLRAPFVVAGQRVHLRASVGAVTLEHADTPAEALRQADLALYAAKDAGKDRVEVYRPGMSAARLTHVRVAAGLRRALVRDELTLRYQPIVDLATGRVEGVEALLRWTSPELGAVPPDEFVPVAEETGLIVPLGAWVLAAACAETRGWQLRHGGAPRAVTVNVSARQLTEPDFLPTVTRVLAATGLPPSALVVEITESVLMATADLDDVRRRLAGLRALGVRVALDDFGTGYSSLAYLRHLPIDIVKMDRTFIQSDRAGSAVGHPGSAPDWTVTRAILDLSHNLGLSAVAEGVETAEQADQLRRLACPYVQGYHFGRPLPPDAISDLLATQAGMRPVRYTTLSMAQDNRP